MWLPTSADSHQQLFALVSLKDVGTSMSPDVLCREWGQLQGVKACKKRALFPSYPKTLVKPGSGSSGGQYLYGCLSCTLHVTCCSFRKHLM